jgi:ATP-dependent DNA helicase RecQ
VVSVLRGENIEAVRKWNHDKLSTYGLLQDHSKNEVRDWVYQLLAQKLLVQTGDEYPVLRLNDVSWQVMRDERVVKLTRHHKADKPTKRSTADVASWEGVDKELFEALRALRREYAEKRGVAPYVIFSDATLRELARVRPSTMPAMHMLYGVGEKKLAEFGEAFLSVIDELCRVRGLARDCKHVVTVSATPTSRSAKPLQPTKKLAIELFADGETVEEVARQTGRAVSTVHGYLCEYIRDERPASVEPWVPNEIYQLISKTIERLQATSLKPVFVELGEKISYDQIRIVMTHRAIQGDGYATSSPKTIN